MNTRFTVLILGIIIIAAAGYAWTQRGEKQSTVGLAAEYQSVEFIIDAAPVTLVDGVSEVPAAPGSATNVTTRFFGNEVRQDLDGDGREDVAFLVTRETGGSGSFFYVVGALDTGAGWRGTHATLIGDRIAPQTSERGEGRQIIINFAERNPGEPFTTSPSRGKSLYLLLDPATMQFGEVVQNFEGEADPARMTLTMTTWRWITAQIEDGRSLAPRGAGTFTLTFAPDGTFNATTDCNAIGGKYQSTKDMVTFSAITMTKMYCEGSQEQEFLQLLTDTTGYYFTGKGELILSLKNDSGTMILR